jgi:ribonuclease HII
MKQAAEIEIEKFGLESPAAMSIDPASVKSKTLAELRNLLTNLPPPYSKALLDALEKDERTGAKQILNRLLARQRSEERSQKRIDEMLKRERAARAEGFEVIAGVDEVGRGPLAGPVVAAAAILPVEFRSAEINDSKALSHAQRREALAMIAAIADIGIGVVSPEEIDRVNIYKANMLAMKLALEDLSRRPDMVFVDGRPVPGLDVPQRAIVKGDRLSMSIAAASIVAKVIRDQMMLEFDKKYPQYMFAKHKGYGTAQHLESIKKYGVCPIHRRSFAPVRDNL